MFAKLLIANRGEIACRIMRTARRLGIGCVAVYSDEDAGALHVRTADEAVRLGPAPAVESYLRIDAVIEAAQRTGAQAIHPGYGFLSENAEFAEACEQAGITFIGPPAAAIQAMGRKDAAKALMERANVPVVPGYHGDEQEAGFLAEKASEIGYPVLLKAVAGGGGKGMRRVDQPSDFAEALDSARREAASSFGDDRVLLEKWITTPRHIEIQVFADRQGNAVHLFERDCSLQRRHQKVIEEAPAPGMPTPMRRIMGRAAVAAAKAVDYVGAGTVEFIADASAGLKENRFYFMEMNTRLQVEHPVTEAITGHDLVEWQLRVAAGEPLPVAQPDLAITGHAVEARIYAEDPSRDFMPGIGTLHHFRPPAEANGLRIDSGVGEGDSIGPYYDAMIAKVIAHGPTRPEALSRLRKALADFHVAGCRTNIGFLSALIAHPNFASGRPDTGLIERDLSALTAQPDLPDAVLATAALSVLGMLGRDASDDPWQALSGFRLWGLAQRTVVLTIGGQAMSVEAVHGRENLVHARTGERSVSARLADQGQDWLTLEMAGHRTTVHYAATQHGLTVFAAGLEMPIGLPDESAGADPTAMALSTIRAPLPGRISHVAVSQGDLVEAGDRLVVLEAMKMEHTLSAPRDGTISELHCSTGDQVQEGALLVQLDDGS
ncbi:MAG: acetyl/propionyl/methylcrotonyl-CoA carboxylase subunit alpha [Pseudomonadota bacterium]